jgi:hypothetical protein
MIRGANGLTDYEARTVAVRTNKDPAAQAKTLAHELAHVKLHGPDNPDATRHRGIGEVEAESVALMIGAAHGMDTSSYTIPYVSGRAPTATGHVGVVAPLLRGEASIRGSADVDTVSIDGDLRHGRQFHGFVLSQWSPFSL